MMAEAIKKNIYRRRFIERVSKSGKLPLKDGVPCATDFECAANGRLMWIHRTLDHYESKSEQFLETRFTGTLQSLCRQFRMEIVVRKKVQDYRLKCDGQIFALKKK
ncbi:hypothetical protein V5799_033684 [Amblyomma americanum]|uniref:Uncharacterized protein n=1 Tax=Amblyomma americanum TaxID=6943 RepID=A0AAQ4DML9_AMBAM